MGKKQSKETKPEEHPPLQQGDVLLHWVDTIPEGAKEIAHVGVGAATYTVAHGESGHSHVLEGGDVAVLEVGDNVFLDVKEVPTLRHEEHGNFTVDKGTKWRVGRVREIDPCTEVIRSVRD